MTGAIVAYGGLLLLSTSLLNRQTTVRVNSTAVWLTGTPIAIAIAVWLLVHWFRPREQSPPPHWNLKQDSPGTWAVVGVAVAALAALTVMFSTYRLALVSAQLLPGKTALVPATVTHYRRPTGRRSGCHASATFSAGWGDEVKACVDPVVFRALVSRELRIGELVQLEVTTSLAGEAVTAVTPSGQMVGNAGDSRPDGSS